MVSDFWYATFKVNGSLASVKFIWKQPSPCSMKAVKSVYLLFFVENYSSLLDWFHGSTSSRMVKPCLTSQQHTCGESHTQDVFCLRLALDRFGARHPASVRLTFGSHNSATASISFYSLSSVGFTQKCARYAKSSTAGNMISEALRLFGSYFITWHLAFSVIICYPNSSVETTCLVFLSR